MGRGLGKAAKLGWRKRFGQRASLKFAYNPEIKEYDTQSAADPPGVESSRHRLLEGSAAEAVACKSAVVLAPPPACIGPPPIEI